MTPIGQLVYWMTEREKIRKKKEAGHPPPWTKDPILQRYRFCNVRRIHDRVSQWLLNEWYMKYFDHPNMLIAATLARQLNNTEALAAIGFPEKWDPERVSKVIEKRKEQGKASFSPAYMITGTLGGPKSIQIPFKVVHPIYEAQLQVDRSSMENTWRMLMPFKGFGSFIAGQVVADLRWGMDGSWSDRMVWAPPGPGSMRGMNRLAGVKDFGRRVFYDEFLEQLAKIHVELKRRIHWAQKLEAIDVQNCLCEYDKYCRAIDGRRLKRNYP